MHWVVITTTAISCLVFVLIVRIKTCNKFITGTRIQVVVSLFIICCQALYWNGWKPAAKSASSGAKGSEWPLKNPDSAHKNHTKIDTFARVFEHMLLVPYEARDFIKKKQEHEHHNHERRMTPAARLVICRMLFPPARQTAWGGVGVAGRAAVHARRDVKFPGAYYIFTETAIIIIIIIIFFQLFVLVEKGASE